MSKIVTLDIEVINEKVIELLKNMEDLNLIRIRNVNTKPSDTSNRVLKYKGAMQKQPIEEVDKQLKELRGSW